MTDRTFGKGALALVSALALAAPLAVGTAIPAAAYSFTTVRIEGAQRMDADTILNAAGIRRGAQVSAGELNAAQQRLQNTGVFETVELVPQGNTLTIKVSEFPVIGIVNFEGNRRIKDDKLAEMVQSRSRRVYSPAQAEADARAIVAAYAADGRMAARVDPQIIRRSGNVVDLAFVVREGDLTEIERIGFTGNRAFSDRRLRDVLATKQAGILRAFIKRDVYSPERIALDERLLTDFYRERGYADFRVHGIAPEIARERDAFFVTYNIYEGPRFTFGRVDTVSEIAGVDAAPFMAQNRVRSGAVYAPSTIDTTIKRMETVAIQQGLDFVNIEPRITRNMRDQTLDLTFALTRGPKVFVERIDIEGNTTTLDQVIRRQFRTVEGDPFNPREIRNAAERVRALGYFADAQVESRQGTTPQQVIVDVNVEEQPTGSLNFGASYGVNSGLGVMLSLSESNFMGRGQAVELAFSTAKGSRSFNFSVAEPYFLGRDLRAKLGLWYTETDHDSAKYNTRSTGISPAIEFPVSDNGRLELRYRLSRDELMDVKEIATDANGVVTGSSPILYREMGAKTTSSVGYTYSWDSRNVGLDPLTSYKFRFSQDFAGLGGDVRSITSTVLAGVESTAWRSDVTLRAELEGGAIHMMNDDTSRITERFRGGSRIRGFKPNGIGPRDLNAPNEDALGGNYFWAARAEAQFPIGFPEEYGITGGLFADVGSVWGLDDKVGANGVIVDDKMHVRAAVGASLFWKTPMGPLRFNLSRAIKKQDYDQTQNFDLTISTKF